MELQRADRLVNLNGVPSMKPKENLPLEDTQQTQRCNRRLTVIHPHNPSKYFKTRY